MNMTIGITKEEMDSTDVWETDHFNSMSNFVPKSIKVNRIEKKIAKVFSFINLKLKDRIQNKVEMSLILHPNSEISWSFSF